MQAKFQSVLKSESWKTALKLRNLSSLEIDKVEGISTKQEMESF